MNLNAVTTGPLFRIAQAAGLDSVTIEKVAPPLIDNIIFHLNFTFGADPVNLNDSINAYPFGGFNIVNTSFRRQPGGTLGIAILGASGLNGFQATQAYNALLSSAGGNTLPGYSPLVGPGLVSTLNGSQCSSAGTFCKPGNNVTNLALLLVNSPTTPNGGLYTRFAPIFHLFGVDPNTPDGQTATNTTPATRGSGGIVTLNSAVVGLGLAYSAISDFPETLNPFSIANSLFTLLPTYLLSPGTLQGTTKDDLIAKLAALALAGTPSTTRPGALTSRRICPY